MARVSSHASRLCAVLAVVAACFGVGAQAERTLLQSACANPMLPDVNLTAYAGVWYQIGSTAVLKSIAEVDAVCISGRYSFITSGPNNNAMRIRSDSYRTSSGDYSALIGLLTVNGRSRTLQFPGIPASDYRIIYLKGDPIKDKYKSAMTYSCGPGSTQCINILSRKPFLDGDSIAELVAFAQSLGITLETNNQIVLTPQDAITCGRKDECSRFIVQLEMELASHVYSHFPSIAFGDLRKWRGRVDVVLVFGLVAMKKSRRKSGF